MSPDSEESILQRARRVTCRPPSRERPDDQIVELFLSSWQDGRFAANQKWLPQNMKNVEVMARDQVGNRLAIEHTRIHSFENHKLQEALPSVITQNRPMTIT